MPLNFEKPPPDPTLGRAKTKEEMKQRKIKVKRKDVKAGLIQQGGFGTAGSDEERIRATQYRDLIRRQTEQARAQFGELPKGWNYVTVTEIDEAAKSTRGTQDIHITNRKPEITLSRDPATLGVGVRLRTPDVESHVRVSDRELNEDSGLDNFVYTINHQIRLMARESVFSGRTTEKYIINPGPDHPHYNYGGPIYETKTSNNSAVTRASYEAMMRQMMKET